MAPRPNPDTISAWFRDAAVRHPDIRHSLTDPEKKHFFELEWDEMMQGGAALAANGWNLILEEYTEVFNDNQSDYISVTNVINFMVITNVEIGDVEAKQAAFVEGRRIAKSIVAKLKADQIDACDADVPTGVVVPREVDLSTLRIMRVRPEIFAASNGCGVRTTINWFADGEAPFERGAVDWLPL